MAKLSESFDSYVQKQKWEKIKIGGVCFVIGAAVAGGLYAALK
jgi:hypothetical protein